MNELAFPNGVVKKSRPSYDPGSDFVITEYTEAKNKGMSLLDYFAAKAMLLGWKVFVEGYSPEPNTPENIAKFSYQMAQAMLEERKKHL